MDLERRCLCTSAGPVSVTPAPSSETSGLPLVTGSLFFFFLIPVLARRIKVLGPASNPLSHPEQILGLSFFICKENDADSKNGGDNNEDDDPCLLISIPVW